MRLSVRSGVFETNSSSTHSLTMADEDDFELFEKEFCCIQVMCGLHPFV